MTHTRRPGLWILLGATALLLVRLGATDAPVKATRHAYLRYVGQGHEIKVALPDRKVRAGDGGSAVEPRRVPTVF